MSRDVSFKALTDLFTESKPNAITVRIEPLAFKITRIVELSIKQRHELFLLHTAAFVRDGNLENTFI